MHILLAVRTIPMCDPCKSCLVDSILKSQTSSLEERSLLTSSGFFLVSDCSEVPLALEMHSSLELIYS